MQKTSATEDAIYTVMAGTTRCLGKGNIWISCSISGTLNKHWRRSLGRQAVQASAHNGGFLFALPELHFGCDQQTLETAAALSEGRRCEPQLMMVAFSSRCRSCISDASSLRRAEMIWVKSGRASGS